MTMSTIRYRVADARPRLGKRPHQYFLNVKTVDDSRQGQPTYAPIILENLRVPRGRQGPTMDNKAWLTQLKWQQQGMYDAMALIRRTYGYEAERYADMIGFEAKRAQSLIDRIELEISQTERPDGGAKEKG